MAVKLYMPSAFDGFRREAEIIGRLVTEYGELEWDLCLLVGHIIQDFDAAFKAMYRIRGETFRIDVADALARHHLQLGKFRTIYETTIAHMRKCLKIRNEYAHTNWVAAVGGLAFAKVEEVAKSNAKVDLASMPLYQLDLAIIEDQQRYFIEVMQNMRYLCMEIQAINKTITLQGFHYVDPIKAPLEAKAV